MTERYTFLVTDYINSCYGIRRGFAPTDNSYIPACIDEVLGEGNGVIFEMNIPTVFDLFKEKHPSGIVMPHGHGDNTSLYHLVEYNNGELGIPVCELYRVREEEAEDHFKSWLDTNFKHS